MYYRFLICVYLFIPHNSGNSISTPSAVSPKIISNTTVETVMKDLNKTTLTLMSEGGSVEAIPPIATLPKEEHSNLINLDKEIGKTKGKSIVPRKGVQYNPIEDDKLVTNFTKQQVETTVSEPKTSHIKVSPKPNADELPQTKLSTKSYLVSNITKTTMENVTKTVVKEETIVKKKPLVLSVEAINETDRKVALENAKLGTSSKPLVYDQMPSPKVRYEQMGSSSHPGMVMPIVITMLVVPMFAVLGYMALRRGQEAWKNRHYKRMDFLLDGMYND